jgi:phosphatidylethanolamine/phosphatidyl-N-methylethanolamine N-methyltransferase
MSSTDTGRAYWERHARNYDRSMLVLGRPMVRMLELVADAVSGADTVLEVAAGTGLVTVAIAPRVREVIATDYSGAMVEELRRRVAEAGLSNVTCSQGDVYALPYSPGTFDFVVAANVLHLLPDPPRALEVLRGLLRPGGRLVVPTFCHDETLLSKVVSRVIALSGFPSHRRFNARSLRDTLMQAGFELRMTETIAGVIPIEFVVAEAR